MTLRFSTSRAIGAAIALTLGSVASATAQIPVRKDPTPTPAPAPTPAPTPEPTPAPTTPPVTTDTSMTTSTTTTTSTVTTESAGEVPMTSGMRWGNGMYMGIHGGANFPQGDINSFYETGFNVGGQLGWDSQNSPLGLRLNVNWNRLNGRDIVNQTIGGVRYESDLQNADLYAAFADAKLRLPFGRNSGSTSGLYVVGGGGLTYFNNYSDFGATTGTPSGTVTRTFDPEDVTRFSANAGGGLSWGLGNVSLFVEGRYVRVFTRNRDTDYVPVTVGLTFH